MEKFNKVVSTAVPMPIEDIDTDQIIPARFLKATSRDGFGDNLFRDWRYVQGNEPKPDFVLNDPTYSGEILVAGRNFGCGSSREHAPWALLDFGIRCVISPSFADIFYNNCFNNGILPIIIDEKSIQELSEYSKRKEEIEVDLNEQVILYGNKKLTFDIEPAKKKRLLEGLDNIGLSLKKIPNIEKFESSMNKTKPWI